MIVVRWDELLPVPHSMDDTTFEAIRREVEKRMRENQGAEDMNCGWRESLL
jgi:hypothetical protein